MNDPNLIADLIRAGLDPDLVQRVAAIAGVPVAVKKEEAPPCYVYFLVDPRSCDPFYVGMSDNPWYRFYSHCHDCCSAAYYKLMELTECGYDEKHILVIHKECQDRKEAFDVEHRLIVTMAGLLNRDKRKRKYL